MECADPALLIQIWTASAWRCNVLGGHFSISIGTQQSQLVLPRPDHLLQSAQVQRTAAREVRVLRGLRHDNVVRLLEAFRAAGRLFLVFELAEQTVLQVGLSLGVLAARKT